MKTNAAVEAHAESNRSCQVEVAVELAMQGRWSEAVDLNRRIIGEPPDDVGGYNRLGRALEALGRMAEAREAYSAASAVDAHNLIATHSLQRLRAAPPDGPRGDAPAGSADARGRRLVDCGRQESREEEPPEVQDECNERYEEYEMERPARAVAKCIELAGELLDEARLEAMEGAIDPEDVAEEREQEERDHALAAEEESDQR